MPLLPINRNISNIHQSLEMQKMPQKHKNKQLMKQLEKEFIGKGEVKNFKFTQLKASETAFIYEVNNDGSIYYEVFKRKENTQFNCISYPSSKAFGVYAWTIKNLNSALDRFNNM